MDLGADAWWPLADFATSRGRGGGAPAFPFPEAVVVVGASMISPTPLLMWMTKLPLSPFPLRGGVGVPAFAKKFLVTETALKVIGFLTELERA